MSLDARRLPRSCRLESKGLAETACFRAVTARPESRAFWHTTCFDSPQRGTRSVEVQRLPLPLQRANCARGGNPSLRTLCEVPSRAAAAADSTGFSRPSRSGRLGVEDYAFGRPPLRGPRIFGTLDALAGASLWAWLVGFLLFFLPPAACGGGRARFVCATGSRSFLVLMQASWTLRLLGLFATRLGERRG